MVRILGNRRRRAGKVVIQVHVNRLRDTIGCDSVYHYCTLFAAVVT